MTPFEVYCCYLSLKNHFTKKSYDYFKYCGKIKTTIKSFNKRKDKYFFEKTSRQKTNIEILEYFVSSFVECSDPERLWIGEIIHSGETNYTNWKKRNQSLNYIFKNETEELFSEYSLDKFIKRTIIKTNSDKMFIPKQKEINLQDPVLRNKGILISAKKENINNII